MYKLHSFFGIYFYYFFFHTRSRQINIYEKNYIVVTIMTWTIINIMLKWKLIHSSVIYARLLLVYENNYTLYIYHNVTYEYTSQWTYLYASVLDVLNYNIWIFPRKKLLISQIVSNQHFFGQYFFTGFHKSSKQLILLL